MDEEAIDAPTWYADEDGDGFGDPNASIDRCDPPGGYVGDSTDCDDTDAAMFPLADGLDEDCAPLPEDPPGFQFLGGGGCDSEGVGTRGLASVVVSVVAALMGRQKRALTIVSATKGVGRGPATSRDEFVARRSQQCVLMSTRGAANTVGPPFEPPRRQGWSRLFSRASPLLTASAARQG